MTRAIGAAVVVLALLLMAATASRASGWDSNLDRLKSLNLPKKDAFTLYYSPSAKAEAEIYAAALEKALAWYGAGSRAWSRSPSPYSMPRTGRRSR